MRRLRRSLTILPVLFAAALLLVGPAAPASAQQGDVAEVTAIVGQVSAVAASTRARPLAANSKIAAGETVVTAPGARVALKFIDGSTINLGEATELKVARYRVSGEDRQVFLDLVRGLARSIVTKMPGRSTFEITTPTAVAAVRSTTFCVEFNAKGETETVVVEGSLAVTSHGGELGRAILETGGGTTVAKGKAPTAPEIWQQSRIDAMRSRAMIPVP
ncbi:MAG TPA: FecR domain-containing protein [Alphaproteobacteria bacterium]